MKPSPTTATFTLPAGSIDWPFYIIVHPCFTVTNETASREGLFRHRFGSPNVRHPLRARFTLDHDRPGKLPLLQLAEKCLPIDFALTGGNLLPPGSRDFG